MKKLFSILIATVLLLSAAACGSGEPAGSREDEPQSQQGGTAPDGDASEPVTISWWVGSWKYEDGRAQKVVEEFEAANPGIKVEITPVAWEGMKEKMLSALLAGQGPDLMNITGAWGKSFAATGGLMEVSGVIDDIGRDSFFEAGFEWTKYNGGEYGIPYRTEAKCLYYNKTMLENAGFSGPPTTLDELRDYAEALTGDGVYGLGLPLNRDDTTAGMYFRYIIRAFGGDFISEDETTATLTTPEAIQAFTYYTDLYTNGWLPNDTLALTNDDTRIQFSAGQVAMTIEGPWGIGTCEDTGIDFGIAPLPGLSGQDGSWDSGGWSLLIPEYSQKKDAVIEFVKFYLQPENDAFLTDALPAIRAAAADEKYANEHMQVYFQQLDHLHGVYSLSTTNSIYQAVVVGLQRMLQGEDIQDVAQRLNQEVQTLIDEAE